MTIEEKAQKYDEAKLRMSAAYNSNRCTIGFMTEIFPELQENEDEKIRKWLIALIKSNEYGSISNVGEMPCPKLNVLAWLEKQGNLMKALQTSNAEIGELIEKNYYLKEQLKKQCEQKPIWSEEDSYMLGQAIKCVNNSGKLDVSTEEIEYWLKSIRLQKWKPTEEQIKALNIAIRCGINPSTWEGDALRSLLEQLKQL